MFASSLDERRLDDLSEIEIRFRVGKSRRNPLREYLVVQYRGKYGYGSDGNSDATFMAAMARAGVEAFEPAGVIHDLSGLHYEWGDELDRVFTIGPEYYGDPAFSPVAIIVSPLCEEAVRSLRLGENSLEPIERIGYIFRDLDPASAYLDAEWERFYPDE